MNEVDRRHLPWDDPEADVLGLFQQIRDERRIPVAIPRTLNVNVETELEAPEEMLARALLRKTTGWMDDEHGRGTPARFARMLREMTTPEEFEFTTFPSTSDEMVSMKDIPFVSVCNHHIIPFVGVAHIGYVPDEKIVGLSKLARTVHFYAKRLQVQENLTTQIADYLMENLAPQGVAVVLEAEHFCMTVRGVGIPGVTTRTAAMRGVFADHSKTAKAEFMSMIDHK
jgi:GTP cyclohydrolase I